MPSAVLGDFLAAADEHIAAAVLAGNDPVARFAPAARDLCCVVEVLSRYCGDLAPCDEVEASGRGDLHPWERAVIDADAALRIAGDCLRHEGPTGEIINLATGEPFRWTDACVKRGGTVGYDAVATAEATIAVKSFLNETFRR